MSDITNLRSRTRTTYVKIDPNAKVRDDNTLDFFINEWYKKIQRDMNFEIPECQWETTLATQGWVNEYDKPADFQKLVGLFQDWLMLGTTTKQKFLINRASQSKPSHYYLYGSKIWLYPTPDNSYSITFLYNKFLPTLTNSQPSILSDDYDEAIALYACYLMMLSVEKQAKAGMVLAQYKECTNGLFGQNLNDDDWARFSIERSSWVTPDDVY